MRENKEVFLELVKSMFLKKVFFFDQGRKLQPKTTVDTFLFPGRPCKGIEEVN